MLKLYVVMLLQQLKVMELELPVITFHFVSQINITAKMDTRRNKRWSQFYYTDVIDFALRLSDSFL